MSKTIIVSNRLPIKIERGAHGLEYHPSAGGLATGLGSIYKEGNNLWLGWPGLFMENESEEKEITAGLKKENMRPVFLSQRDIEEFYEGFSNSTLWPLFHYFTRYAVYEDYQWEAYKRVNQMFCDEILKYAEPDDVLWIHDYQLLLLPEMLREALPNASIGFFNHIPFPSYEIFRLLPWRESILRGMVGADLIGFHTYDDMRHFMSSASRLLGIENQMGILKMPERQVAVDAFPMGIDYEKYEKAAISRETQKEIKGFLGSLGDQQLVLSIDRLDYSKGIPQRIKAFDKFLEEYPEFQGKVSLILLVVPSRDNVEEYKRLKEELDLLVGRTNGKYSMLDWNPIYYFYRSLPFHKLSALYAMSDVAFITPLRDGMNLVCKEYIASRLDKTGVLILSEMAGSAKELSDAILVNPNDLGELVGSLHKALTMSEDEQVSRNTEMQTKLKRYNIHRWVEVYMDRLSHIKEYQNAFQATRLTEKSANTLVDDYAKADKRLLLLDYDGTLSSFKNNPQEAGPDDELREIISGLTADPQNRVVMISGRDKETLGGWLGDFNVEFVCEHGVWLRERETGPEFQLIEQLDMDWKEQVRNILELQVDRTPGSFIEEKHYSLVWHYRDAEQGLGDIRARELVSNLQFLTSNVALQVLEGNKVIEVKNAGVNKGRAAMRWLGKESWDFIFAAGDDWTDEDTFHVLPDTAYDLKVGFGSSEARFNIADVRAVRDLLKRLVAVSQQAGVKA